MHRCRRPPIFRLRFDRTFGPSIASRNTPGMFGLGWTTSWQASLSVDSAGNVTIDSDGSSSLFVHQANGTYLATAGVTGSLTLAGVYTYTNINGNESVFQPDGQLSYVQDTNGNRITLGYNTQNQITTLTYSNPADPSEPTEQLSLTYNAQGFVSQAADGTGNVWTYSYDTAGHLLSVTAPGPTSAGLTTTYSYDTGTNPETANALLSIIAPNGTQQNFTYDSLGRLSSTSTNGGAGQVTYTYPGEAEVETTDSAGDQTFTWFNTNGQTARTVDALGGESTYVYDTSGNLATYTDAAGYVYQYTYNQNGQMTQSVNPLGQTQQLTYGALGKLTSTTDAAGNTTQYGYDAQGNQLSITYPDGTKKSFSYDPLGNLTETILQNGDPINYQYDAQGHITEEDFADGSYETFAYDAHGNLTQAQTYDSTSTLTGTTTLTYDAASDLTSVSYPGGLSLSFTYNAQGERTSSVDQSGYTLSYSYDALGRLTGLSDGSGMVVTYAYNNLGQLVTKTNGNGTHTTYAYDADGNLTKEINYADPSGTSINSSFTYAYNILGEMTAATDQTGNVTTYGYNAIGELTQVTLPDGTATTYVYNAAGDRTQVVTSGMPTAYASNADNEITQVGSAIYTYDANGNLNTVTDSTGTTTYSYNDLNQLVSISDSDGSSSNFQYSPLGFLVGTSATDAYGNYSQSNYLVDPSDSSGLSDVVSSYDDSGNLIAHYDYGVGLASQTGPSGTGYYDFDATGNTIGITGAGGTYVNQYSYLPFGETTDLSSTLANPSAELPNPFTFVGEFGVMQIGANLFNMRERDYTPATGQFLSNDPLGTGGGDLNIRRYAGNDPALLDPNGTEVTPPAYIISYIEQQASSWAFR